MSFDRVPYWIEQLSKKAANPNIAIVIVGNKSDLEGDYREVPPKPAEDFAKQRGLHYIEASAKEDKNVTEAFDLLLKLVLQETKNQNGAAVDTSHHTDSSHNILLHSTGTHQAPPDGCC